MPSFECFKCPYFQAGVGCLFYIMNTNLDDIEPCLLVDDVEKYISEV